MVRTFIFAIALITASAASATEAGWALLRTGGQVVLLRHAYAPGMGDPANFDIDDCSTQRNMSDRGESQARRIGALFGARGAPIERVETSRFCRCRDTAQIAFRDEEVIDNELLDWFPDDDGNAARMERLQEEINNYTGSRNLIMVTQEPVIRALVGAGAREGEAVIVWRGSDGLGVAGRIRTN